MTQERRKLSRRDFSYYMRVMDEATGKLAGHLSDISANGFKLDCPKAVPLNVNLTLRIEQTDEISSKSYLTFTGRALWSHVDELDPNTFNVGFQIVNMTPSDYEIFLKMFNTYGNQKKSY